MEVAEFNALECDFLFRTGFRAHVQREEYDALVSSLGVPLSPFRPVSPSNGLACDHSSAGPPFPRPCTRHPCMAEPSKMEPGPATLYAPDWVVFGDCRDQAAGHGVGSPAPPGPAVQRCFV